MNISAPYTSLEHLRVLWVGIGCKRGTSRQVIEAAIHRICQQHELAEDAIAGIATIEHKADEVGIVELCRDRHWPLRTFCPNTLHSIRVPNPSTAIKENVGTPSVAEAAALCAVLDSSIENHLASNASGYAQSACSANASLALRCLDASKIPHLLVPKQIFRLAGQPGAVTVAIAQTEQR